MKRLIIMLLISVVSSNIFAKIPGHQSVSIEMLHHGGEKMGGNMFFPVAGTGTKSLFGGGPTFNKIPVIEDERIVNGIYPLVIYSHDWDGGLGPQSWIPADLAARGAIAVHIDHKYSLWGENDVGKALNHWTRVQDIEATLKFLLASKEFGSNIDRSRIMIVGFGEGGLTALSAGGATAKLQGVVEACKFHGSKMRYCDEMMSAKVDLASYNEKKWNASYKIDDVSSVAVIEPSLVYGLEPSNVQNLVKDIVLFSFKDGGKYDVATDIDASGLADVLSSATRVDFDPAYRFSAALKCQVGAESKLAEEGRFPVCTDPIGSDRDVIHKKIIDILSAKLGIN